MATTYSYQTEKMKQEAEGIFWSFDRLKDPSNMRIALSRLKKWCDENKHQCYIHGGTVPKRCWDFIYTGTIKRMEKLNSIKGGK